MERVLFLERSGDLGVMRQMAVCQRWALDNHCEIASVVHREVDAVALVRLGEATRVVAALVGPDDDRLRMLLDDAGGELRYCRRIPDRREHDTGAIVVRMFRRGGTAEQISQLLGVGLARVRQIIRVHQ